MSQLLIDLFEVVIIFVISTIATLGMWSFLAWINLFNPAVLATMPDIGRILIFGCIGCLTIVIKYHLSFRKFN